MEGPSPRDDVMTRMSCVSWRPSGPQKRNGGEAEEGDH